jgi:hypothetical protein
MESSSQSPTSFVSLSVWERLTSGLNNAFHVAKDHYYSAALSPISFENATLLGKEYTQINDVKEDWLAKPYFTYRTGFCGIDGGLMRSDQGWYELS